MEPEDKDKLIKEYEEEIEQLKTLNETLQNHVDLKEAEVRNGLVYISFIW